MADIKIDVGQAALRTTTGSQTLSISGFGTPKAILAWIVPATFIDTPMSEAAIGYFVADDAGNCGACGMLCEPGQATSNTRRWSDAQSTGALYMGNSGSWSTELIIDIDSDDPVAGPTTDGWVIDVTTAPGQGWTIMYVLFGGSDLSAHVASADMTNLTGAGTETITPGFQSDVILFCGPNTQATTPTQVQASLSFGAYDGTNNYAIASGERDGRVTTKAYGYASSSRSLVYLYDDAVNADCYASNITSTQYDVVNASGSADYIWHFLALNLGGASVAINLAAAPSSAASDWVVSGLGFTPQAAMVVGASPTANDTITDGLVWSFGVQAAAGGNFIGISSEDAVSTGNSKAYWADQWIAARDHQATKTHDINPSASPFESGGWTVDAADISTASAANRWLLIAFEVGDQPTTGSGTFALPGPTLSGSGDVGLVGAGAFSLALPTLSGTGEALGSVSGSGSFALSSPALSGAGSVGLFGSGALSLAAPALSGAGSVGLLGSGAFVVSPTLSGTAETDAPAVVDPYSWDPAVQVSNVFDASPLAELVTHLDAAGVVTLGTFYGLFLTTQPELEPQCLASWADDQAKTVARGDQLQIEGQDPYTVEGVRPDGAYLLRFALRPHVAGQ